MDATFMNGFMKLTGGGTGCPSSHSNFRPPSGVWPVQVAQLSNIRPAGQTIREAIRMDFSPENC
jgi:hypothetical protein